MLAVSDRRTCGPEGSSICECNYCRPPESECCIKSPPRWPNFIQRALHSQRPIMTEAGVPRWKRPRHLAVSKTQPQTGGPAAPTLRPSAEMETWRGLVRTDWTFHLHTRQPRFLQWVLRASSSLQLKPTKGSAISAPMTFVDAFWHLSQTMFDGRALEIFNGVQSAINLAGGSGVNSDSAVLIPALCLLAEVTRILSPACKGVNNVNTVN